LIGYWTGWFKANYPAEFICASLSYGDFDDKSSDLAKQKKPLLEEIIKLGITIMPPKKDLSDPTRWTVKNNRLYVPFIEIIGVGETQAQKCAQSKNTQTRLKSFFGKEYLPEKKNKIDTILDELKVFDPEVIPSSKVLSRYLPFSIEKEESYCGLKEVLGFSFPRKEIPKWKTLYIPKYRLPPGLIRQARFRNSNLTKCRNCELVNECRAPVMHSCGMFNVMIIGEAAGPQEDEYGRGFYEEAPAGELLWEELALYDLTRRMFHVTNIVKCYPGKQIKTPTAKHIVACSSWLKEEFTKLQPRLVLAIGNTCVKAFTGQDGGIQKLNGTTQWIESLEAWVCWCLHPAAVKRAGSNREYFERGIRNFSAKFAILKPIKTKGGSIDDPYNIGDDIPF